MSMLQVTSRQIGPYTFQARPMPVVTGREALVRLNRTFGPALGELVEGGMRGGAARAFASFADRLSTEDLAWFCTEFGKCSSATTADGRARPLNDLAVHDELFAGNYEVMFAWLEFCLEVNFRGFFEKARNALSEASVGPSSTQTKPE